MKPSSSVSRVEVLSPGSFGNAFGTVSRTVSGVRLPTPQQPAVAQFTACHIQMM